MSNKLDGINIHELYNITTATNVTYALPTAVGEGREFTIFRTGAGGGKVLFTTISSQKINDDAASVWFLEGAGNITLVPVGGNWRVKEFSDIGSNANGTWEKEINGRLKMFVGFSVNTPSTGTSTSFVWTFPYTRVGTEKIFTSIQSANHGDLNFAMSRATASGGGTSTQHGFKIVSGLGVAWGFAAGIGFDITVNARWK